MHFYMNMIKTVNTCNHGQFNKQTTSTYIPTFNFIGLFMGGAHIGGGTTCSQAWGGA